MFFVSLIKVSAGVKCLAKRCFHTLQLLLNESSLLTYQETYCFIQGLLVIFHFGLVQYW